MALFIVGGTTVDVIFARVPWLPVWPAHTEFTTTNLALLAEPPLVTIGGNGANAAYVAARCGARVSLQTNLAPDAFGGLARTWLEDAGCKLIPSNHAGRTPVNVTAANHRLQRATLFYPGATPRLPATVKGHSHTLVCGWPHPPLSRVIRLQRAWRRQGIFTAFDAGPILGKAPTLAQLRPLLATLDLFLANEHELQALTRTSQFETGVSQLRKIFAGHVVIKCGPRGAWWLPAGEATPVRVNSPSVRAQNTVGAGDTFNGALLAALAQKIKFLPALRFAAATAASVVGSPLGVLGVRIPHRKRR